MSSEDIAYRLDLLGKARDGDARCLGRLLELYRNYLHLVARMQMNRHLEVRASPSDIVQEAFMQACRDFRMFRGNSEQEFLAWLRRILVRTIIASLEKHLQAQKRSIRREQSLNSIMSGVDESTRNLEQMLVSSDTSPSVRVERREMAALVADRLAQLPEQYREVVVLRNLEGLSFSEVARQLGRTDASTRKLWTRAIARLRIPEDA